MPKLKVDLVVDDKGSLTVQKFAGKASKSLNMAAASAGALAAGLGAIVAGGATTEFIRMSDAMTLMHGRIDLVGGDFERVFALANSTRQALEPTVDLYTRMARATEDYNISQDRLLALTESINKALIVSGAAQAEAAGAIRQLSQGMASGVLRGQELNSVMEQTPRLARMIAEGMGVTIGELRQLGKDGKITTDVLIEALEKSADAVNAEFKQMPETIGQAFTVLGNVTTRAVGGMDKVYGASSKVVDIIHTITGEVESGSTAIIEWRDSFMMAVIPIQVEVIRLGMLLDKVGGTMTFLASLPSAIPAALGVDSSEDRMDRMAELNVMYEQRYKEKDLMLQALSARYNALEAGLGAPETPVNEPRQKKTKPRSGGSGSDAGASGAGKPAAIKKTTTALREANSEWQEFNRLEDESARIFLDNRTPAEEYADTVERLNFLYEETSMSSDTLHRALGKAQNDWVDTMDVIDQKTEETFGDTMADAFTGWAAGYSSTLTEMLWNSEATFGDIAESFGRMLTDMMVQEQIMKPFIGAAGTFLSGLGSTGPAFNSPDSSITGNYGPVQNAKGNVYSSPSLSAFSGTVVNQPTSFAFANGGGVMGEAGYEGIFPLKRGRDGKLGVVAQTGGSGDVTVNVYNESGDEKEATASSRMDEMRNMIIDVVLSDKAQNGKLNRATSGAGV